jgi:hypothetical protein
VGLGAPQGPSPFGDYSPTHHTPHTAYAHTHTPCFFFWLNTKLSLTKEINTTNISKSNIFKKGKEIVKEIKNKEV